MLPLPEALAGLERLRELVDRYDPIKYTSTDEAKALGTEIPVAYGAVEEIYKHFAGNQKVELVEGQHRKVFPNYFEAGYLSGRTFHATEGRRELLKVIGRVRAELSSRSAVPQVASAHDAAWRLLHPKVQSISSDRFQAGQYADAVEAAMKALNNEVRALVRSRGAPDMDGAPLMRTAFSPKSPIIVLADLSTQSGKDMQQGYMEMFAGAMMAVRNPKAHDNLVITPERALHLLFVASTLWHTLDARR